MELRILFLVDSESDLYKHISGYLWVDLVVQQVDPLRQLSELFWYGEGVYGPRRHRLRINVILKELAEYVWREEKFQYWCLESSAFKFMYSNVM